MTGDPRGAHTPPDHVVAAALDAWGQLGERHLIPIAGCSMLPLIRDGDRVLVAHGSHGARRGDVVVFRHAERMVAHRVLRIRSGDDGAVLTTQGDNAPHRDPPLAEGQVVGRVLAIERGDRRMSLDSRAWRALGWAIATGALARARLTAVLRVLWRRAPGSRPSRLGALARKGARASLRASLWVFRALFGRWTNSASASSEE